MKLYALLNVRNPLWPWVGGTLVLGTLAGTGIFLVRGPKPLAPVPFTDAFQGRGRGQKGEIRQVMGEGTFRLFYDTAVGDDQRQDLEGVTGILDEPATVWTLQAPTATGHGAIWDLGGPLKVAAMDARTKTELGRGASRGTGSSLRWEKGVWYGQSDLLWDELRGPARGTWVLPKGWRRDADGRFKVEQGPVTWTAALPGTLKDLSAQRMDVAFGLTDAVLEEVTATLEGGTVQAQRARIDQETVRWEAPVRFARTDGWVGVAQGGVAPRPAEGQAIDRAEWREVRASRTLPHGTESIQSQGARWTPPGFRLEGDVRWTRPLDPARVAAEQRRDPSAPKDFWSRVEMRAPRVLFRQVAGGADLPADLAVGQGRAEGQVVMTWGRRTLSTPTVDVHSTQGSYVLHAPTLGRGEMGTFSAGRGAGTPDHWVFEGPVQATLLDGRSIRGGRLTWEGDTWTLDGRPVSLSSDWERLSGARLVRQGDTIFFPDGLSGSLAAPEGELTLRADRGESQRQEIRLTGAVECHGAGWTLTAQRIDITLGPGRKVVRVVARNGVTLDGSLGQGRGESIEVDLLAKDVRWQGRVRGSGEVRK